MNDALKLLLFAVAYIVAMKWVLPRLGVPTCMSGSCNVAGRHEGSDGDKTANPRSTSGPESR